MHAVQGVATTLGDNDQVDAGEVATNIMVAAAVGVVAEAMLSTVDTAANKNGRTAPPCGLKYHHSLHVGGTKLLGHLKGSRRCCKHEAVPYTA